MLKSLTIKNFAVISELTLEFGGGLNIFTGETGAGKSILIEALGFALGARASAEFVKSGALKTEVSAVFSAEDLQKSERQSHHIAGDAFTIRRELDAKGKGKAFLDSKPVPVAALAALGDNLVDFHGQHEHQTLLKQSMHLELLDRFGKLDAIVSETGSIYRQRQSVVSKLEAAKMSKEEKERLLDLYKYQLADIEDAQVKAGEDEELESLLPKAKNAEKLKTLAEDAYGFLYSREGAAVETAGKASKIIAELALLDPALEETLNCANEALVLLEDAAGRLSAYKESADIDPRELDAMLARQDKLSRLKKKYGPGLAEVLAYAGALKAKISDLQYSDEKEQELVQGLAKINKKLFALCEELHDKRIACAARLSRLVLKEIEPLGFPEVRFSILVEMDENNMGESGADTVEFLFAPNPGQPLKPLKNIASGGEMSRVMLGLKTVLANADKVAVMVFDEVDAGVGGVVGRLVGEKLSGISSKHQVLCVTHLAQVAGFGDAHFHVSKANRDGATYVTAARLEGAARVAEIAKMLGGKRDSSKISVKHAEELLEECRSSR